jgi:NAD(P)-dependent dehydrogenase (short-subunit alcohol dehydrogenase family)
MSMSKVALISGANRGLGFETARQLGQRGITVILGARDEGKGQAAAQKLRDEGIDASSVELDVSSQASVRRARDEVAADHDRLDILVNNAGILPEAATDFDGPLDSEVFRRTFETNVFGAVTAIEEFLPLLRASSAGRIVNVSSTMGSLSEQHNPSSPYHDVAGVPAYRASKTALNGITVALSRQLADTPIKVNSICPGSVQTDLAPGNREQAPLTPEEGSRAVIAMATIDADGPSGQFVDADRPVDW